MKHYTAEELESYSNAQMSVLKRIFCKRHLQKCAECAGILEEIKKDEEFITDLQHSLRVFGNLSKE